MSKTEDGGPAFPLSSPAVEWETAKVFDDGTRRPAGWRPVSTISGASMRDYFAAKAMQGMLADLPKTCYGLDWTEKTAAAAFQMADAMLLAREVKA